MTLPQIWNALHEGEVPEPGTRTFNSTADARAWRAEQAAKRGRAEAERRRREVAAWRNSRKG